MDTQHTKNAADHAAGFTKMWTDFATRMTAVGFTFPSDAPPDAARHFRDAMLEAMSQSCETYFRSAEFLEGMKQSMDSAITLRKQFNEFLTHAHHEMQGVARDDVDSLMLAVRHLETRVLDRIEAIGARVDELHQRMDAMNGQTAANAPARPEPKPTPEGHGTKENARPKRK